MNLNLTHHHLDQKLDVVFKTLLKKDTKQNGASNDLQKNTNIWRPSSELDQKEPVDPLIGLDDLQDQTSRSNDQKNQNISSLITNNHTENKSTNRHSSTSDDD
ncbi:unnamed protein product [Rotaria sp. Silwood1]|nr:unnamed protein product [Rotaria sp. Silwood1]